MGRAAEVFDAREAIARVGLDGARRNSRTAAERVCVDAAAALDASRAQPATTLMGAVAVTCLPHRDIGAGPWRRALGATTYVLHGGVGPAGAPTDAPYGAKARIILLHLADGAIRGGSPSVEVQASMRAWMQAMGIAPGGMTYRHIAEQARRIAGCRMQIMPSSGVASPPEAMIEGLEYAGTAPGEEGDAGPPAFPVRVRLARGFYRHLLARPAALDLAAVRLISDNSWALDLYVWLATILPTLSEPTRTSWASLFERIDFGYAEPRKIRAKFLATWALVKAVYPEAAMTVERDGVVFGPSPPAARGVPGLSSKGRETV